MEKEKKKVIKVIKKDGAQVKTEKISTLKKSTPISEKIDGGEKEVEFDINIDDLKDRLNNLFVDIDDRSVPEVAAPKPTAVVPDKVKRKDERIIIDAVKNKWDGDGPAILRPPALVTIDEGKIKEAFKKPDAPERKTNIAPGSRRQKAAVYPPAKESNPEKEKKAVLNQRDDEKKAVDNKNVSKANREYKKDPIEPVTIDESNIDKIQNTESFEISDLEIRRRRFYRKKFVLGGILIILVAAVLFIVFKIFVRVEGDEQQKAAITRKIDPPPLKIEAKTVNLPSDILIAQKTDAIVPPDTALLQKGPEVKDAGPSVEKEKNVLNAPPVSFPYSIHAESYRSLQSAQQSAEIYLNTGLQAFWVRVDLGEKGVWYRVLIDCYKDPATAQKVINEKQLKHARPIRVKYANFIGAYLSDDDLKKQSRFLSEKGYVSYSIQDTNGQNYLYTGAFDTAKEAEKFSVELSARGIRSLVVER
ncbi:MAG: hypothetical protein P1P89_14995 [Desulfobacterales bacterium]|nr:hypothetical protein [Desulfobacterales bacterium]